MIILLNIFIIVGRLVSIHAEDLGQDAPNGEDDEWETAMFEDNGRDDGLRSDEKIIILFIFLFFAYIIAFLGSFLAYVSWQDDRIMDLYFDKGLHVEGDVVSTEFARCGGGGQKCGGGGVGGWGEYENQQKEYLVSVEYNRLLSSTYPVRIRKQLRVMEGELFHPDHPERDQAQRQKRHAPVVATESERDVTSNPCSVAHCGTSIEMDAPMKSFADCPYAAPKPLIEIEACARKDSFFGTFHFNRGTKLELLVMPNHHLSALPVGHIERRLSHQHRLFSIAIVGVAALIAAVCFRLASQCLLEMEAEHDQVDNSSYATESGLVWGWVVYWAFVVLVLAQIPCIHGLLRGTIRQSLEQEYFEVGELIKGGQDDSSLSTGSDSFFVYRSMDSLSTSDHAIAVTH